MEKQIIELPCKVGEKIWFIRPMDCKSGECEYVDTDMCEYSAFHIPTEEVRACSESRLIVDWTEVDVIDIHAWGDETDISINGYIDPEYIYSTQEEALKAAESMEYEYLFVVDEDGEK